MLISTIRSLLLLSDWRAGIAGIRVLGINVPPANLPIHPGGSMYITFPEKNTDLFNELFNRANPVHDGHRIFPCVMCRTAFLSLREVSLHYKKIHRFNISSLHLLTMKVKREMHGYRLDNARNILLRVPRIEFIKNFTEYLKTHPQFYKPWRADVIREELRKEGKIIPEDHYLTRASSLTLHLYANGIKAQWDTDSLQYLLLGELHRAGIADVKDKTHIRTTKEGWDIVIKIAQEIITG